MAYGRQLKVLERGYNYLKIAVFSVGMPSIRPLETLHNALSLRHLDTFLGKAIVKKPSLPEPVEASLKELRKQKRSA